MKKCYFNRNITQKGWNVSALKINYNNIDIKKRLKNKEKNRTIILGLIAQWTRARGYEPRCRGFESLFAQIGRKRDNFWGVAKW